MLDIQVLVDFLSGTLSVPVEISRAKEINLTALTDLPKVYVAYASIQSKNNLQNLISQDIYEQNDEDTNQFFDIKIVCEVRDLSVIWLEIRNKLSGWNPSPADANYSGFSHTEGGIMGEENKRLWHLDRWMITLPKLGNF